jgi:putative ATPase
MTMDTTPLAARMRPQSLDEVVGQDHLLGPGQPFRAAVDAARIPSLLLWGPPGSGKTTLARLLAGIGGLRFAQLSATMDGIKDLRGVLQHAKDMARMEKRGTLLFVDEIHRWNKSQQDALLPHVEEGTVVLVGATTENPGFQVIPALRSRSWLLTLEPLAEEHITTILSRALSDEARGLGARGLGFPDNTIVAIARSSSGDARRALAILERIAAGMDDGAQTDLETVTGILGRPDLLHDKDGDTHYDIASALIKSLRGSDPDAALYWSARLLEGGEDPMFVARRLVIFASEDIGNADPRALTLAVSTMQGTHLVGMPEARILIGQTVTYLATAPKSNAAYKAMDAALELARTQGPLPVPKHLRNTAGAAAKAMGHGEGYRYPHDFPDHIVKQDYLPAKIAGTKFYTPTAHGAEKTISERLSWWKTRLKERGDD